MNLSKSQIVIVAVVVLLVLLIILVFVGIIPGLRDDGDDVVKGNLVVWGIDDGNTFMNTIVSGYSELYPQVSITYHAFSERNYEDQLINALAAGKGPDIFMVHNTWGAKHSDKLAYLSEGQYSVASFRDDFPQVVVDDFNSNGRTYAIPLYLDTLVLFYNRDIFNNEGIISAPKTWEELNILIPRLKDIDSSGHIERAAIPLGGSKKSINNASDILALFMLQDGVEMISPDHKRAIFASNGEPSLRRYLAYANPANSTYTWNDQQKNALDSFATEDSAMLIEYLGAEKTIQEKNPFLNFAVSAMPQRAASNKAANYADYWGLGVSGASPNTNLAWGFVGSILLNKDIMANYSKVTQRPAALLSLIAETGSDPQKEFFARQSLTASSWFQSDYDLIQKSFSNMISSVLEAKASPNDAIIRSQAEITQSLVN